MEALPRLNEAIALAVKLGDNGTRDLLEAILTSEEEHVDWLEAQLDLIDKVGQVLGKRHECCLRLFTRQLFEVWFRLGFRFGLRLRLFRDQLFLRLFLFDLGLFLFRLGLGWRWRRQRFFFEQQLRNARWNLDNVVELGLGRRQERPDDAERQGNEEYCSEQPLEFLFLPGVYRPGQFIFSVER